MKAHYRNVFSQNGEDGVLEHVLAVLGITDGLVVEVGAWNGLHASNTAHLWRDRGFRAVLIEADWKRYAELLVNAAAARDVRCVREHIEPDGPRSLDAILSGAVDVTVLSIDVDGADYALLAGLQSRPVVIVVEVDSSLGPDAVKVGDGGASFAAMNALARKKGYRLLDHCGNCVYVRDDHARAFEDVVTEDRSKFSCTHHATGFRWWRPPFMPTFDAEYRAKLLTPNGRNPIRDRAAGFGVIFTALDALPPGVAPRILETGCVRPDHGDLCYGDDGCATVLFDHFARVTGACVVSVDIDPEHVAYARSKVSSRTEVVCGDSVSFLHGLPRDHAFDLIYLDSFDIDRDDPLPAQVHHMKELAAVLKNTRPGTLVAVDDCDAFFDGGMTGKGTLVTSFMADVGAELLHDGYQRVWRLR